MINFFIKVGSNMVWSAKATQIEPSEVSTLNLSRVVGWVRGRREVGGHGNFGWMGGFGALGGLGGRGQIGGMGGMVCNIAM